jgi:hypothetical protein
VSHYGVEPADKPKALTSQTIKALRHEEVKGISRRRLLRTTIGALPAPRLQAEPLHQDVLA